MCHLQLGNGQPDVKEGQAPPAKLTVKELAADSSLVIMAGCALFLPDLTNL